MGGVVSGGMAMPASSGPFVPATTMGTTATFSMSSTGYFPYYCIPHAVSQNMNGAVFVVP
jgi:plastocyanin